MNILRTWYIAMEIFIDIYDETYHIQILDDMLQHLPWYLCHLYLRKGHPINDVMISYG